MYPKASGSTENHKRGCCSDGVPVRLKTENVPPWPQPLQIFTDGTHFHPAALTRMVGEVTRKLFVDKQSPGSLRMEYEAFAQMLLDRVELLDGICHFRIYRELQVSPWQTDNIVEHEGTSYVCLLDCLGDDDDVADVPTVTDMLKVLFD